MLIDPEVAIADLDRAGRRGRRPLRARRPRHPAPRGLFPPARQRPRPERNPIEAGLGWCCKEATGFLGSRAIAARRAEGTAEKLAPFTIEGAGIPREGNPVLVGGEVVGVVTSGTFSPSLEIGAGMAYVRADLAEPGTEVEIDVRGKRRPARIASKPLYQEREMILAEANYPEDLRYHDQHDWVRIDGDERPPSGSPGTPRTRSARSSSRAARGRADDDQGPALRGGRVGEGRLRRDRADVRRGDRGQRHARRRPEQINEDPYGEGWLVKVKLSAPTSPRRSSAPTEYQKLLER